MQYLNFLLPTLLATILTIVAIPRVKNFALKVGAVDNPGGRRIHKSPTPRMGGIAIAASFFAILALFLWVFPDYLEARNINLLSLDQKFWGFILGSLTILAVGIYDDIKNIKPSVKFGFQLLAIAIVMLGGINIEALANPAGENPIWIGNWGYLLVPIWILFMTNAMNWFDGVDGLSGGLSTIALFIVGILSMQLVSDQSEVAFLAFLLAGATIGFLPFNWHPAKIFLGDSGSMFLGFSIAVLAIISDAKMATTALVLGLPLIDAAWVILRRLWNKRPIWKADNFHLHHRFLRAGFTPPMIASINYLIAITLGIIALEASANVEMKTIIVLPLIIAFFTGILIAWSKKQRR